MFVYDIHSSPIGDIHTVSGPEGLIYLDFKDNDTRLERFLMRNFKSTQTTRNSAPFELDSRIASYFRGAKNSFDGLPLDLHGTAFQKEAWHYLLTIPYGETKTYGEEARMIGRPKGAQAVGQANGKNPISIIIPCHRVIGGNGSLTGYAGGIERKSYLLSLERGDLLL